MRKIKKPMLQMPKIRSRTDPTFGSQSLLSSTGQFPLSYKKSLTTKIQDIIKSNSCDVFFSVCFRLNNREKFRTEFEESFISWYNFLASQSISQGKCDNSTGSKDSGCSSCFIHLKIRCYLHLFTCIKLDMMASRSYQVISSPNFSSQMHKYIPTCLCC